jgi:hypothetical protein
MSRHETLEAPGQEPIAKLITMGMLRPTVKGLKVGSGLVYVG